MTSNQNRKYSENQYKRTPDPIMESGFTNYERLLVELNNRMYYPQETYEKFLNENGLLAEETFDKNTDHAQLLETVYSILQTLLSNTPLYKLLINPFV